MLFFMSLWHPHRLLEEAHWKEETQMGLNAPKKEQFYNHLLDQMYLWVLKPEAKRQQYAGDQ